MVSVDASTDEFVSASPDQIWAGSEELHADRPTANRPAAGVGGKGPVAGSTNAGTCAQFRQPCGQLLRSAVYVGMTTSYMFAEDSRTITAAATIPAIAVGFTEL